MGLFSIGRAIIRGVAKVIKQNYGPVSSYAPQVSKQTSIQLFNPLVRSCNGLNQIRLNFTCRGFYYNGIAADIRRSASQDFLRRYATKFPMFAFVGLCLADNNNKGEASLLALFTPGEGESASLSDLFNHLSSNLDSFWKKDDDATFPSKFSEYNIGERLGKPSSHAAVYSANHQGKEVALKIMFNYGIPSNAAAISQAYEKEYKVLPCAETPDQCDADNIVLDKENNEAITLKEHPNIIKLHGKFVDNTPLLPDSIESYPMALPRRLFSDGYGRNRTLCLIMPKYTYSLREYLRQNSDQLSNEQRISMLQQMLEGVAHLERHNVSHRDLKSDNLLVGLDDHGHPRLVITDFGSCLAEEDMLLPFNTINTDKGGNMALMAPEIVNAVPRRGLLLDYSKADAWTCGSIAYEMFTQQNPFYTHVQSSHYEDEILREIPLCSGNSLIDKMVHGLLRNDPQERISACEAATMLALMLDAPREWLTFPRTVTKMDIQSWLLVLSINTRRECKLYQDGDGRFLPPDIQMKLVFLSRISPSEILNVLVLVDELQNR